MSGYDESTIQVVADDIERYLAAHPNAADSVEGIVKWWLTRQKLEESTQAALLALERLVHQGIIVKTVGVDSKPVYRLCK